MKDDRSERLNEEVTDRPLTPFKSNLLEPAPEPESKPKPEPEPKRPFKFGDHVRLTVPHGVLPSGAVGIVQPSIVFSYTDFGPLRLHLVKFPSGIGLFGDYKYAIDPCHLELIPQSEAKP